MKRLGSDSTYGIMAVYKRTPRECVGSCPVLGHFVDGCLEELGQMSLNRHYGAGSTAPRPYPLYVKNTHYPSPKSGLAVSVLDPRTLNLKSLQIRT